METGWQLGCQLEGGGAVMARTWQWIGNEMPMEWQRKKSKTWQEDAIGGGKEVALVPARESESLDGKGMARGRQGNGKGVALPLG